MGHVLVVGGTGMLRAASLWLATRADAVSVVARSRRRLDDLAGEAPGVIHPIRLDYRDGAALEEGIRGSIVDRGPIETGVCWIHSVAPDAPAGVAAVLEPGARYFDLSGTGDPDSLSRADARKAAVLERPGVLYRRVVLGRIGEGTGWRWLTDEEISEGVIRAIETDAEVTRIGG